MKNRKIFYENLKPQKELKRLHAAGFCAFRSQLFPNSFNYILSGGCLYDEDVEISKGKLLNHFFADSPVLLAYEDLILFCPNKRSFRVIKFGAANKLMKRYRHSVIFRKKTLTFIFFGGIAETANGDRDDYTNGMKEVYIQDIASNLRKKEVVKDERGTSFFQRVKGRVKGLFTFSKKTQTLQEKDFVETLEYSNPPGRVGFHTALYHNKNDEMIVFGGRDDYYRNNNIWRCVFGQKKWVKVSPKTSSPRGRGGHSMNWLGNDQEKFIVHGGIDTSGVDSNETFKFSLKDLKWEPVKASGKLPSPRASHSTVVVGRFMFLYGGASGASGTFDNLKIMNDLFKLDTLTGKWEQVETLSIVGKDFLLPQVYAHHSGIFVKDSAVNMFVLCGISYKGKNDMSHASSSHVSYLYSISETRNEILSFHLSLRKREYQDAVVVCKRCSRFVK